MKILWLCNIATSEINNEIGSPAAISGGWIGSALKPFNQIDNLEIIYLFPNNKIVKGQIGNVKYFSFDKKWNSEKLETYFQKILNIENPDIIHIWGTEFSHSLSMARICGKLNLINKVVVSIQGLVSQIYDVYTIGIDKLHTRLKTIRDFIKCDSIEKQRQNFKKSGIREKQVLSIVKNIIGRTEWDKNTCLKINGELKYYLCNENLRDEFYQASKWNYDTCEKYRIFFAQASYPLKGFHLALRAIAEVKKFYPNVKIVVTGFDFISNNLLKMQTKTYYFTYLRKLVKKLKLENNVEFVGNLNAVEMSHQLQMSNLFLSSSLLENSSNAICEAMMLGVPVIASNVGGSPTMVNCGNAGILYDSKDINQLAQIICEIFNNKNKCEEISEAERIIALKRHNKSENFNKLLKIYDSISNIKNSEHSS